MERTPILERQAVRGTGIGLRTPHIKQLLDKNWDIPWLEILSDNFLSPGGLDLALLDRICKRYPVTLHGVNLSLGGASPLDMDYLKAIKQLSRRTSAVWISEHACFSHGDLVNPNNTPNIRGSHQSHDLLPLPYTEETIHHLANRINQVQDFLGEQILLENVSAYLGYKSSEMSEGEFLACVAEKSDCLLLLDINNAYVNARNFGGDPMTFFNALPMHRVKEIHLAGYADKGAYLLDAHNNPVSDAVWQLYESVIEQLPNTPTLIEWDNDIPELEVLMAETEKANRYINPLDLKNSSEHTHTLTIVPDNETQKHHDIESVSCR